MLDTHHRHCHGHHAWQHVRFAFTPPPAVKQGLLVALGRLTSGTVQWADVKLLVA